MRQTRAAMVVDGGEVGVRREEEGWCVYVCMWQKLGGIERALTLRLYGPTVNGDKRPARSAAQPDDVPAHVPSQFGEAGGLQQEGLLGLHGGLGTAAVPHRYHVVGLAGDVTPGAGLLDGQRRKEKVRPPFCHLKLY